MWSISVVRDQINIDLASMLSSRHGLSLPNNVHTATLTVGHNNDFSTQSDSNAVISRHLKKISKDLDFSPRLPSLRLRLNTGLHLAPGARTRDGSCQDQYSDTISSNEKLADLKEKPRTHLQINLQAGYNWKLPNSILPRYSSTFSQLKSHWC